MLRLFLFSTVFWSMNCFGDLKVDLDGSYLFSTIEERGAFSIVERSGVQAGGELAYGGPHFEGVLSGGVNQGTFIAPVSRTLLDPKVSAANFGGGVRFKSQMFSAKLGYSSQPVFYIENEPTTNVYDLKTKRLGFYDLALELTAVAKGFNMSLQAEGMTPAGTSATDSGLMKYQYIGRGAVHLEFGSSFRVGLRSGVETQAYSIGTDSYFRNDFFAGITLGFGGGKKSGGGLHSDYQANGPIPGWPIN